MGTIAIMIIKLVIAVVVGVLAGHSVVYLFNRLPAEWLCDYGEEPSDSLRDTSVQRIKGYPWKLILSGLFICIGMHLVLYDWQFCTAAIVYSWALAMIFAADRKYGIIPDQFVLLTAATAMGFIPFHDSFLQQIYGVLIGAGVMLLSALLGKLVFRKETLGFGDVKLFAAIGLALGMTGTLFVLVASSLTSAIVFAIRLIRKKIKHDDMLPLGPYICGAGIFYVAIIWPLL